MQTPPEPRHQAPNPWEMVQLPGIQVSKGVAFPACPQQRKHVGCVTCYFGQTAPEPKARRELPTIDPGILPSTLRAAASMDKVAGGSTLQPASQHAIPNIQRAWGNLFSGVPKLTNFANTRLQLPKSQINNKVCVVFLRGDRLEKTNRSSRVSLAPLVPTRKPRNAQRCAPLGFGPPNCFGVPFGFPLKPRNKGYHLQRTSNPPESRTPRACPACWKAKPPRPTAPRFSRSDFLSESNKIGFGLKQVVEIGGVRAMFFLWFKRETKGEPPFFSGSLKRHTQFVGPNGIPFGFPKCEQGKSKARDRSPSVGVPKGNQAAARHVERLPRVACDKPPTGAWCGLCCSIHSVENPDGQTKAN